MPTKEDHGLTQRWTKQIRTLSKYALVIVSVGYALVLGILAIAWALLHVHGFYASWSYSLSAGAAFLVTDLVSKRVFDRAAVQLNKKSEALSLIAFVEMIFATALLGSILNSFEHYLVEDFIVEAIVIVTPLTVALASLYYLKVYKPDVIIRKTPIASITSGTPPASITPSQNPSRRNRLRGFFTAATISHVTLVALVIAVSILWTRYNTYSVTQAVVVDTSRTLLELNGTLLTLVLGFAIFYLTIIETKRQSASTQINSVPIKYNKVDPQTLFRPGGNYKSDEELWQDSLREAAKQNPDYPRLYYLLQSYREMMQAFSRLLIIVSLTFAAFLFDSYLLYLYASPLPTVGYLDLGNSLYLYSISLASPFVTISDVVLIAWYLSRNIAGKPYKAELKDLGNRIRQASQ